MYRDRAKLATAFVLALVGLCFVLSYSGYSSFVSSKFDRVPEVDHIGDLGGSLPLIVPSYFPKHNIDSFLHNLLKDTPNFKEDYKIFSLPRPKMFPEKTLLINDYSSVFHTFKEEKTHIYDSATDINGKIDECRQLESDLTYTVSNQYDLKTPAAEIVEGIVKSMDEGNEYSQLLADHYFLKEVGFQLKHGVADRYWFRLAGSSVWLKEYGVHFMVSRLVYSERKQKNHPKFSAIYAQIYTDDWVEIKTSLLVPTNLGPKINRNAIEVDGDAYTIMKFPMVLPVPFRLDRGKDYQGPEDPRILLVQNEKGHEEPLILFNEQHAKKVKETKDGKEEEKFKDYRDMWMSWPWQFQRGKFNIDDENKLEYDDLIFNKATEIMKKGDRKGGSKNWTPMVSNQLRHHDGYDKYIFFTTRFPKLEVYKCHLADVANCEDQTIDDNEKPPTDVGDLRGGTAMININDLITQQTDIPVEKLIKKGREVWVGMARAHFKNCGCGNGFYRPNVVIITLDLVTGEDNKVRQVLSLSHTSGFMDLYVDILPWEEDIPDLMCIDHNVVIPNGIDFWKIGKIDKSQRKDRWLVDDMLTLTFSVTDKTVSVIKIRGLLEGLINMSPHSPFKKYEGELEAPFLDDYGDSDDMPSHSLEFGASDDVILCAMEDSKRFCRVYGEKNPFDKEEWEKQEKEHPRPKKVDKEDEEYVKDLKGEL